MLNETFLTFVLPLVAGFILDLALGDPLWLPHPIRLFGNTIQFFEKQLNHGKNRIAKGAMVALLLILFTWGALFALLSLLSTYPVLKGAAVTIMLFYGMANRSLISEALKVNRDLRYKGLDAGRKQLSFIVGRDTSKLSENQVRVAVLETLAENLSDGVIAPLFYYALGGVPLMFAYKMVNTLDSMIGYKNERFKDFGLFAARIDDVANFVPARLTALLMVLLTCSLRGVKFILRYGHKHSSPNSGYPEAALAGILNCRFGGPNVYHGVVVNKPFIGNYERTITNRFITLACWINFLVSLFSVVLIVFASLFLPVK